MNIDFSPTPLLETLIDPARPDLQDPSNATERSIRDLLGEPNQLPCRKVQDVLRTKRHVAMMNEHTIRASSASILSFLYQLKTLLCRSDGSEASSQSSLRIISKLSTIDRFLQLMFEHWLKEREPQDGDASGERKWSTEVELINQTLGQIVQGLAGMVTSVLEAYKPSDIGILDDASVARLFADDITESVHAFQIAFFVCGFLIRLNHYTRFRPSLLSPLWKSICSIVETLPVLPEALASKALTALSEYIKEGLIESSLQLCEVLLQRQPDENLQPKTTDMNISKHEYSHKILIFLIGRLTTFLSLDTTSTCSSEAIAILITAMGIDRAMATPWVRQVTATNPNMAFDKLFRSLSNKAEKALCTSLRPRKGHAAADATCSLPICKLEVLLQTRAPEWPAGVSHEHLISRAFTLGKTLLMVKLLKNSIQREKRRTSPSEPEVNCMLRLSQELIFIMIPLCHTLLLSENSIHMIEPELICVVTGAVAETLLYCENEAPCLAREADPGRARFYQYLVSWLLPPLSSTVHPMAKEFTINVLHLHLLALSETNAGACANLLSLLVKLLFSERICTALRANITCLLTRITQSSHSCSLMKAAIGLIVPEAIRLEEMMRPLGRGQKRKRCRTLHFGVDDLRLICRITSKLPCRIPLIEGSPSFPENISSDKSLVYGCVRISLATSDIRGGRDNTDTGFVLVDSFFADFPHREQSKHRILLAEILLSYIRSYIHCHHNIADTTRLSAWLAQACSDKRMIDDTSYMGVTTEAIYAMKDIAQLVGPSTTRETLETLGSVFHRLLSSEIVTIRSEALSALVACTLAISEAHKAIILPISLPKEMRLYLKNRMDNSTDGSATNKDVIKSQIECAIRLRDRCAPPHFSCSVFPSINSFRIPVGSYVVTMPVEDRQHGRTARVIFPPTKESLEDIRFIHGGDDMHIQSIQRVAILSDGSLKVYMTE